MLLGLFQKFPVIIENKKKKLKFECMQRSNEDGEHLSHRSLSISNYVDTNLTFKKSDET